MKLFNANGLGDQFIVNAWLASDLVILAIMA